MKVPKVKELSERTKAEMARGQAVLRIHNAVNFFTNKLTAALNGNKYGWRIGEDTYCAPDEKFRIYVHVGYGENLIEIIEHEDDFPSEELIAQLIILTM